VPTFSFRFAYSRRMLWRLFALLVSLSLNMVGGVANAKQVAVSFSGILNPGQIDTYGVFGPKGGNLGNQPFSESISYDASEFIFEGAGAYYTQTSGAMTISVTVNGVTKRWANVCNCSPPGFLSGV